MAINLYINDLIEWLAQSEDSLIERIVWIDEGYTIAFLFDIKATKGFPYPKSIAEITEAIADGVASRNLNDPWARIIKDDNLSEREINVRNKAWNIILPLVAQEPDIYYRHLRGSLVKEVVEKYNQEKTQEKLVEKTVYDYLRRYWQRGKTKNALIPDYINSAGKGTIRKSTDKKRGRPRKYGAVPDIGKGINITEEDRRTFRTAITKFYNNRQQNSLTTAYKLMLKEYYTEEIVFDDNGVKKSILIAPEKRPTLNQFRYWYNKEQKDIKKTITSRRGSKTFELQHRAILGTSKQETIGPGSRYQIDATVADVYLVSEYNRNWIIGRPVIYVVIDVFSRMITGVYVGLEGPSWLGMMMALVNAATDKVKFCAEYGIEITEEEWLAHHIPDAILGDRGELAGKNVETSIGNLGIRIENAAPYRADWKGLVERHFRIIHDRVKPFLDGYVNIDSKQRGGKDYRLDAKLDLNQFTEIIIHLIRHHNNHHYLENYDREEMMITDNIDPIPRELWRWGIANRSGKLRTFSEDIVKLNLMPADKATITPQGIKFKKLYYTCEKARKEQWFERARSKLLTQAEKSLNISYDPRKPDFIYLRSSDGREYEKCFIIDPDDKYIGKTFDEIENLWAHENLQQQKYRGQQIQQEVDLMSEIETVVKKGVTLTDAVQDKTLSNNQKVQGIKNNRVFEKQKRREQEGFELSAPEKDAQDNAKVEIIKPSKLSGENKTPNSDTTHQSSKNSQISSSKSVKRKNLSLIARKRKEQKNKE
jgi:hypothetical protein